MRLFRMERKNLYRLWAWSCLLAALAFLILAALDRALYAKTGVGTYELQRFSLGAQFQTVRAVWGLRDGAVQGGFVLGLDYLFMPLYATALFCSGLVAQDYFAPRARILGQVLAVATLAQPLGALFDAIENALEMWLLLPGRASDSLASIAVRVSGAKMACVYMGLALLLLSLFSLQMQRQARKLRAREKT